MVDLEQCTKINDSRFAIVDNPAEKLVSVGDVWIVPLNTSREGFSD